jgi:hypothetical protein
VGVQRRAYEPNLVDARSDTIVRVWPAALAGAEASLLGGIWAWKEFHHCAPWAAARTGRSAVNARGVHGVDESPIGAGISVEHGSPAIVVRRLGAG